MDILQKDKPLQAIDKLKSWLAFVIRRLKESHMEVTILLKERNDLKELLNKVALEAQVYAMKGKRLNGSLEKALSSIKDIEIGIISLELSGGRL